MPVTSICLNMIVKDEAKVIERVLRSVQAVIDYYVIVDTGSSDETYELIQQTMTDCGVPGELHQREWVNFGHNRQQALELTYAAAESELFDFVLFIDADEELIYDDREFYLQLKPGVSYETEQTLWRYQLQRS